MHAAMLLSVPLLLLAAGAAAPAPVSSQHPMISEVLYAVPTGDAGDANLDAVRSVNGDEFVELVNTSERAIDMQGYKITDSSPAKNTGFSFTFPACKLAPGGVAVVFNGCGSKIPGAVGDSAAAAGANDLFHGALVFTARVTSKQVGLANAHDAVLLWSPGGVCVESVKWGTPKDALPASPIASDAPLTTKGSVHRLTPGGPFVLHEDPDGKLFSPGMVPWPIKPVTTKPAATTPAQPTKTEPPAAPTPPAKPPTQTPPTRKPGEHGPHKPRH